jgi:hypothetical protein
LTDQNYILRSYFTMGESVPPRDEATMSQQAAPETPAEDKFQPSLSITIEETEQGDDVNIGLFPQVNGADRLTAREHNDVNVITSSPLESAVSGTPGDVQSLPSPAIEDDRILEALQDAEARSSSPAGGAALISINTNMNNAVNGSAVNSGSASRVSLNRISSSTPQGPGGGPRESLSGRGSFSGSASSSNLPSARVSVNARPSSSRSNGGRGSAFYYDKFQLPVQTDQDLIPTFDVEDFDNDEDLNDALNKTFTREQEISEKLSSASGKLEQLQKLDDERVKEEARRRREEVRMQEEKELEKKRQLEQMRAGNKKGSGSGSGTTSSHREGSHMSEKASSGSGSGGEKGSGASGAENASGSGIVPSVGIDSDTGNVNVALLAVGSPSESEVGVNTKDKNFLYNDDAYTPGDTPNDTPLDGSPGAGQDSLLGKNDENLAPGGSAAVPVASPSASSSIQTDRFATEEEKRERKMKKMKEKLDKIDSSSNPDSSPSGKEYYLTPVDDDVINKKLNESGIDRGMIKDFVSGVVSKSQSEDERVGRETRKEKDRTARATISMSEEGEGGVSDPNNVFAATALPEEGAKSPEEILAHSGISSSGSGFSSSGQESKQVQFGSAETVGAGGRNLPGGRSTFLPMQESSPGSPGMDFNLDSHYMRN